MTRILALETAGETCSVAIMDGDEVLEHFEQAPRRQTERVLPMVEAVLAQSQLSLGQLDGIAFGHGPGAFTGVRVAAAVTQGLAFAADLPVIGVSTLAACALSAQDTIPHRDVIAVFDARMGEIYLGAYACEGGVARTVFDDGLFHPDTLPSLPQKDWLIVGSGLVYREALCKAYGASHCEVDVHPHAKAVAQLALSGFQRGQGVSAELAQPVYLRDQVIQGAVR